MTRVNKKFLYACIIIVASSVACNAFAVPMSSLPCSNKWEFSATIYGWVFGQNGDITVNDTDIPVNTTPSDTIDLITDGKIDAIFEGHFEASKGRWSFMIDPTYLKVSESLPKGPLTIEASTELLLVDFGAFYTLGVSSYAQCWSKLELLAGGRYLYSKMGTNVSGSLGNVLNKENSAGWLAPMLGVRLINHISPKWNINFRGDFSTVSSISSWSAIAVASYSFTKCFSLQLGYRALHVDAHKNSSEERFGQDLLYYGPMLGLSASW